MVYGYDANANLTSDGATTYTYDVENRLISAAGQINATLKYDPLGRLYEVSSNGNSTRFVYDGNALVAEYTGAGALTNRYVHGPGTDEPLVWFEGAGVSASARRYLHTDHQGSVNAITDAVGTPLAINTYDSFGVGAAANLGRFLQTDPIGYEDQANLYAYVGNDPVNKIDPAGMVSCGSKISGKSGGSCKIHGLAKVHKEGANAQIKINGVTLILPSFSDPITSVCLPSGCARQQRNYQAPRALRLLRNRPAQIFS